MFGNLTGWHLLVLLAVILLLFGATKLPALAKSVGQSARAFKGEMKQMKEEERANPGAEAGAGTGQGAAPAAAPAAARSGSEHAARSE